MATLHMILKILSFPFSLPPGYHWMLILGDDKRGDNDDSSNDQAQVFSLLLLS